MVGTVVCLEWWALLCVGSEFAHTRKNIHVQLILFCNLLLNPFPSTRENTHEFIRTNESFTCVSLPLTIFNSYVLKRTISEEGLVWIGEDYWKYRSIWYHCHKWSCSDATSKQIYSLWLTQSLHHAMAGSRPNGGIQWTSDTGNSWKLSLVMDSCRYGKLLSVPSTAGSRHWLGWSSLSLHRNCVSYVSCSVWPFDKPKALVNYPSGCLHDTSCFPSLPFHKARTSYV